MDGMIFLTVFTDPMMGLSYESEPIIERLRKEYGDRLEIRYVMSVLVRDVADFMTPEERAMEPEKGVRRYCERLAKIYKSEESVGGLPIHMDGFRLFDTAHRTSKPLCLAYKAAQLAAPDKADAFLIALRRATVLDCRPTTHFDEILKVVCRVGIDGDAFIRCYHEGAASALEEDLAFARRLGVYSLPSYLIRRGDKVLMMQSFDYRDFENAIERLSG